MLKRFLLIFLPLLLFISVFTGFVYHEEQRHHLGLLKAEEDAGFSKQQKQAVTESFHHIISDLLYFSEGHELLAMLDGSKNFTPDDLARDYLSFSRNHQIYDQIRYLDETGQEIIRIDYNSGTPYKVESVQLQNKGGRYYFKESMALGKGEIFVSPFDLNKEKGVVERPYKPMIRFATPIFDSSGKKRGVIILNFLGEVFLNSFRQMHKSPIHEVSLLNSEGYFLMNSKGENEWGFMFEGKKEMTFFHLSSEVATKVYQEDEGQFLADEGLFTFSTVYPLKEIEQTLQALGMHEIRVRSIHEKSYYWKVISHLPERIIAEYREVERNKYLSFYSLLILASLIGCFFMARLHMHREEAENALRVAHARLEERVEERTAELARMNATLEERVSEEISARRTQEQLMIQQSKMAAMGEMVSSIAHQWRQPLNSLSLLVQDINDAYQYGELDKAYLNNSVTKSLGLIQYMSHTVDDFRNFFHPSKEKVLFSFDIAIKDVLSLLSSQLLHHEIRVRVLCGDTEVSVENLEQECSDGKTASNVLGYPNEFKQVLMNIINNAREVIEEKRSHSGKSVHQQNEICIRRTIEKGYVKIFIEDSGGGIPEKVLSHIFDPYFTTKEEGKGTGIGLYMAKVIVEKNMGGSLTVKNSEKGAVFIISMKRAP